MSKDGREQDRSYNATKRERSTPRSELVLGVIAPPIPSLASARLPLAPASSPPLLPPVLLGKQVREVLTRLPGGRGLLARGLVALLELLLGEVGELGRIEREVDCALLALREGRHKVVSAWVPVAREPLETYLDAPVFLTKHRRGRPSDAAAEVVAVRRAHEAPDVRLPLLDDLVELPLAARLDRLGPRPRERVLAGLANVEKVGRLEPAGDGRDDRLGPRGRLEPILRRCTTAILGTPLVVVLFVLLLRLVLVLVFGLKLAPQLAVDRRAVGVGLFDGDAKDVAVNWPVELVDRRLTPAARVEAPLRAGRDRRVKARDPERRV